MKQRIAAIQPSKSEHWNTPPSVIEKVKIFGGGKIDLDPCSNGFSQVRAEVELTKEQKGLTCNWENHATRGGLIFVNPPYDMKTLQQAVYSCSSYGGLGWHCILLVPCKTDQTWFQGPVLRRARAICFIKGRVKFLENGKPRKGGAPMACCLIWFGPETRGFNGFLEAFSDLGTCLKLR